MIGSSILVSILSLVNGIAGFLSQLVIARLFGASTYMDAYLIAISIPLFASGLLSAVLNYSLVPALMTHNADLSSYRRFAGLLLFCIIAAAMLIACVGIGAAPLQIQLLGNSLPAEARGEAMRIARISWLTVGLTIVVGHLSAVQNAARKFIPPAFLNICPFVGMIVAGLVFGSLYGPLAIAWGMFAGYLVEIFVLLLLSLPDIDFSKDCLALSRDVGAYIARIPLMLLAMLCFTVYQAIDAYWAPQMGTGNLAYLGYAQRILVGIGTLLIAGPSAVLLPRLAEAHVEGRDANLLQDTARSVRGVVAFAIPVAIFISLLASPLVRLCFERGAFDRHATTGVAGILPIMMFGMVLMLCVVILFRALFSMQDILRAAGLGFFATISYFTLSGMFSKSMGVKGIAIAYALSWGLVLVLGGVIVWQKNRSVLFSRDNLLFIKNISLLNILITLLIISGRFWLEQYSSQAFILLFKILILFLLSFLIFFVLAVRVFKINEIYLVYSYIAGKLMSFKYYAAPKHNI